jgi:hypothetical protein
MVLPVNPIPLNMNGLYFDQPLSTKMLGINSRVVVDRVDTIPLLEDHDEALRFGQKISYCQDSARWGYLPQLSNA